MNLFIVFFGVIRHDSEYHGDSRQKYGYYDERYHSEHHECRHVRAITEGSQSYYQRYEHGGRAYDYYGYCDFSHYLPPFAYIIFSLARPDVAVKPLLRKNFRTYD